MYETGRAFTYLLLKESVANGPRPPQCYRRMGAYTICFVFIPAEVYFSRRGIFTEKNRSKDGHYNLHRLFRFSFNRPSFPELLRLDRVP